MWTGFPLFPEQASSIAQGVDNLYFYLVGVTLFFSILIFLCILVFAIKYRRRSESEIPPQIRSDWRLETTWIVIPLILTLVMFGWGTALYFQTFRTPKGALEIYVVGKQWMWKIQHSNGRREINELHVPIGRDVKLVLASEDVIHSFYLPVFRVKKDAVPGRYATMWFKPTKTGEYHLFCAEYCGTKHSGMVGRLVVMEPKAFETWLSGGVPGEPLQEAGQKLFSRLGCNTCHLPEEAGRCPSLEGRFGREVLLQTGEKVVFDEAYARESILNPRAKVVAGYRTLMPTFQGLVSEEGVIQLIAYIRSLSQTESIRNPAVRESERMSSGEASITRQREQ